MYSVKGTSWMFNIFKMNFKNQLGMEVQDSHVTQIMCEYKTIWGWIDKIDWHSF